jgi:dTDP-4-dehydrorhamnose 3,5-epimerase
MPFRFRELDIAGVIVAEAVRFEDDRGFFAELYKESAFVSNGIPAGFVQDNFSRSSRHTLRGLHFQLCPEAQGKLVMPVSGVIFDVAVDIRKGSPTYRKWVGEELDAEKRQMIYVPEGFAHGFCVLSDSADVLYKVTAEYARDLESGIRWDDPSIAVRWPVAAPRLSERDAGLPTLEDVDNNFE